MRIVYGKWCLIEDDSGKVEVVESDKLSRINFEKKKIVVGVADHDSQVSTEPSSVELRDVDISAVQPAEAQLWAISTITRDTMNKISNMGKIEGVYPIAPVVIKGIKIEKIPNLEEKRTVYIEKWSESEGFAVGFCGQRIYFCDFISMNPEVLISDIIRIQKKMSATQITDMPFHLVTNSQEIGNMALEDNLFGAGDIAVVPTHLSLKGLAHVEDIKPFRYPEEIAREEKNKQLKKDRKFMAVAGTIALAMLAVSVWFLHGFQVNTDKLKILNDTKRKIKVENIILTQQRYEAIIEANNIDILPIVQKLQFIFGNKFIPFANIKNKSGEIYLNAYFEKPPILKEPGLIQRIRGVMKTAKIEATIVKGKQGIKVSYVE
ncbi:hypothetical protein KKC91_06955 [bacterium]|nr:hypothetical protein [bacterium]